MGLPFDFICVDLADQLPDVERGVAAREAADSRRQEQDGECGEERLRSLQRGRTRGRPGMLWLNSDHGQPDFLDLDDGGA